MFDGGGFATRFNSWPISIDLSAKSQQRQGSMIRATSRISSGFNSVLLQVFTGKGFMGIHRLTFLDCRKRGHREFLFDMGRKKVFLPCIY